MAKDKIEKVKLPVYISSAKQYAQGETFSIANYLDAKGIIFQCRRYSYVSSKFVSMELITNDAANNVIFPDSSGSGRNTTLQIQPTVTVSSTADNVAIDMLIIY